MALKTSDEYVERLQRMKPNVYAHGRKIGRDDPMLELPINTRLPLMRSMILT
jgi:aromatic ring hydroxylase